MKHLLNNKPFALAGGVFGLVVLVWRLMTFGPAAALLEVEAREGQPEAASSDEVSSVLTWTNRLRNSLELALWKTGNSDADLRRDPFAFPKIHTDDVPGAEGEDSSAPKGGASLELQAISTLPDHMLVVINRQIVAVGGDVDGFRVMSIEKDRVTLSGFGEQRVITLGFDVAPSAAPSDSDAAPATPPAQNK
jgi:hypothetical protein